MNPQPKRVCHYQGIPDGELERMVRLSTPFTHRWANRRWHSWIFEVVGDPPVVHRMAKIEPPLPPNCDVMYDECFECEGKGCGVCGWHGETPTILDKPPHIW